MAINKSQATSSSRFRSLSLAAFLVVGALFLFVSTKAGTRGVGLSLIACALLQQVDGRIEYGWEGRAPSGYITGWPATLLNLVMGLAGLGVFIWPEVAIGVFGWQKN